MIIPEAIPEDASPLYPDVLVLQGLPGSGKSTWWKEYFQSARVFSADFFFYGEDKKYRFDKSKVDEAQCWCLAEFIKALQNPDYNGLTLIVDNNNLTAHEASPYMNLPRCFNRRAILLTFHCPVEVCIRRQAHRVPVPVMMRKARMLAEESSRFPPWWQHEYVFSAGDGMEEASWVPSRESV